MQFSVTVTIHRVTSSRDAASAGKGCGAHGVSATVSASMASVTKQMAHVPAHQVTVGSSAGNHALPDSMDKTAGIGVGTARASSLVR